MVQRPKPPDITTVEHQGQIDEICDKCRTEGRFAFDTEFVMEDRFEAEVCLIQLATASSVAIIDPLAGFDVRAVWELVCDDQVETVVHAGQEDLGLCVQHTGRVPRRVYDVQIAAGFAGYDYPLSLQKLVQTTLHVRLHKTKTLSDWRRRPLKPDQIRYGAEDVHYLVPVRAKLHERLSRRKRLEWAREEFARFEEMSFYRRAEEEKLLKIKGSRALSGRQLALARELLAWREDLAEKLNRPIRAVLKDHLLIEIAKLELSSFLEIQELRGLNLSGKHLRLLCSAAQKALKIPSDKWPTVAPRDTETPREAALVALMTAVIRSYCLEHELAYGLVASKKSIRELARCFAAADARGSGNPELLSGWRGGAVGGVLQDILNGRATVRVDYREGQPLLRIRRHRAEGPS